MCGGPPGIHTKMTEVSESAVFDSDASARKRNKSGKVRPPIPSIPSRKNSRRETGPGQEVRLEGIRMLLRNVRPGLEYGGRDATGGNRLTSILSRSGIYSIPIYRRGAS